MMPIRLLAALCCLLAALPAASEDTSNCFKAIYALKEGQAAEAIDLYTACIETGNLTKKNLIVAHNDRGNAYGKTGQYPAALADFERVIELDDDDPDAFYNRGLTYKRLGRADEALADYDRAIEIKPRYSKAYNNRGSIFGERGQFRRAIDDFDTAIAIDPSDASAWFNRGLAYYGLGAWQQAAADLEHAIELDADYVRAYENLAWLRATCPDDAIRDGVMAVALARKARFLRPGGTPMLYDILAAAYASRGRFDEAVRYQELAIDVASGDALKSVFRDRLDLYRGGESFESSGENRFLSAG